jgi:hypothetical protein
MIRSKKYTIREFLVMSVRFSIFLLLVHTQTVLGIRDILVRIRIRIPGSIPLTNGSGAFMRGVNWRRGGKALTGARICKPFKEPRKRFPACRASTTTLFVVPVRQATYAGGIESSESIPGLLKRLLIRAQCSARLDRIFRDSHKSLDRECTCVSLGCL